MKIQSKWSQWGMMRAVKSVTCLKSMRNRPGTRTAHGKYAEYICWIWKLLPPLQAITYPCCMGLKILLNHVFRKNLCGKYNIKYNNQEKVHMFLFFWRHIYEILNEDVEIPLEPDHLASLPLFLNLKMGCWVCDSICRSIKFLHISTKFNTHKKHGWGFAFSRIDLAW